MEAATGASIGSSVPAGSSNRRLRSLSIAARRSSFLPSGSLFHGSAQGLQGSKRSWTSLKSLYATLPCIFAGGCSWTSTHNGASTSVSTSNEPRMVPSPYSSNSSSSKCGQQQHFLKSRKGSCIRASVERADPAGPYAPLQLESPVGQFLSEILISHPHLLSAAVEQQLQQLKTDYDADLCKEQPSVTGTELTLYRRIAEVKANDRKRALEEILYTLVVQRFMDADVSLVPSSALASASADQEPSEENKLEQLHSTEAFEMIKNHLHLILGQRLEDSNSVAPISKLRIGQVYAASVMYGYFLRRVDQRFQLEKNMKTLPWGSDVEESAIEQVRPDELRNSKQFEQSQSSSWSAPNGSPGKYGVGIRTSPLRSYVMSFDSETLQRYATIRSKEAFSIIEKHTEALFGRPEIVLTPQGTIDSSKDELVTMSFAGLRRLILEAVTFGSFLWDVESYVDSRYHFVTN